VNASWTRGGWDGLVQARKTPGGAKRNHTFEPKAKGAASAKRQDEAGPAAGPKERGALEKAQKCKKATPHNGVASSKECPATSYSPTTPRLQYHRR
jgi:hypothetical protein